MALERVARPPRRPRLLEPRGRRIGQRAAPPRIRGRRALLPHLAAARLARRARRRRAAGGRDAAAVARALRAARRADGGGARGGTAARGVAVFFGRARARRPRAVRRAHARVVRRAPAASGGARPLQCGGDALAARRAAPPVGALCRLGAPHAARGSRQLAATHAAGVVVDLHSRDALLERPGAGLRAAVRGVQRQHGAAAAPSLPGRAAARRRRRRGGRGPRRAREGSRV